MLSEPPCGRSRLRNACALRVARGGASGSSRRVVGRLIQRHPKRGAELGSHARPSHRPPARIGDLTNVDRPRLRSITVAEQKRDLVTRAAKLSSSAAAVHKIVIRPGEPHQLQVLGERDLAGAQRVLVRTAGCHLGAQRARPERSDDPTAAVAVHPISRRPSLAVAKSGVDNSRFGRKHWVNLLNSSAGCARSSEGRKVETTNGLAPNGT